MKETLDKLWHEYLLDDCAIIDTDEEQVGVANFPESDDNDGTSDNSGGWISHDIYINLN